MPNGVVVLHLSRFNKPLQRHHKVVLDATEEFHGFAASRRNYDVAQGIGADGRRRSGVLEPSWRIGGASSAELAALAAFARDPSLKIVRASHLEEYGEGRRAPAGACVDF